MDSTTRKKLRLNAKAELEGYGIPWEEYSAGEIRHNDDDFLGAITYTHKKSGRQIVVGQIWYDNKTAEILQVGSNYGCLTL